MNAKHNTPQNSEENPGLLELGRHWLQVGMTIRDRTLNAVDGGLQATSDALQGNSVSEDDDGLESHALADRLGGVARTWLGVGLEIGRGAVEATTEGVRTTADTIAAEVVSDEVVSDEEVSDQAVSNEVV